MKTFLSLILFFVFLTGGAIGQTLNGPHLDGRPGIELPATEQAVRRDPFKPAMRKAIKEATRQGVITRPQAMFLQLRISTRLGRQYAKEICLTQMRLHELNLPADQRVLPRTSTNQIDIDAIDWAELIAFLITMIQDIIEFFEGLERGDI